MAVLVVVIIGYVWMNRGYGEIDPRTYDFAKAVYSACLKQDSDHLDQVSKLLSASEAEALPVNEKRWIETMIEKARTGNWGSAAADARRMLEDQAVY